ncbi:transglycosylase SLT domain-containing protein [candidate division KSB1 bacterium]|nr:transglycosylase SLT domain-containing protein [candidate division KSB1 bacterium]
MENQIKNSSAVVTLILKLLLIILLLIICTAGIKYIFNKKNQVKIAELQNLIIEMRTALNIDSVRQYNIKKAISIIDLYNVKMPRHKKYEIAEEIYNMAIKYSNLNVELICATITYETGGTWDPEHTSDSGALGLMQIMPVTAMFVASQENINWSTAQDVLFNPIYNIRIGSRFLSALIELYDVEGGLAAFTDGQRRGALWLKNDKASGILSKEGGEIVQAIQRLYKEYQELIL